MAFAAEKFLQTLSPEQRSKAQFSFADEERYHWNFVPMNRKGISLKELNSIQRGTAMELLRTGLSQTGYNKTTAIMELETVLKKLENRSDSDHYRDPSKYFFSIFGKPAKDSTWGWRLEGHHVSLIFHPPQTRLFQELLAF
jgi:hypothetical protein